MPTAVARTQSLADRVTNATSDLTLLCDTLAGCGPNPDGHDANVAHPLLAILPVVREACRIEGAKCQLRRALGQPYAIEVEPRAGRSFTVELVDDVPKHRSFTNANDWIDTDHDTLVDDLIPQVGFEVSR